MPELRRGARRVVWTEAGAGLPLLLLHAGLGRGAHWRGVTAQLADRFRGRAPDLPGHGATDRADAADSQAEAIADALAVAGGGAFHLAGHSYGGATALRLAVLHPERVQSLTLFEPVMFAFLADAGDPAYEDSFRAFNAPMEAAFAAGDTARAARIFLKAWNGADLDDLPADRRARVLARFPLVVEAQRWIAHADNPARLHLGDIAGLRVPLTLVRGALSPPPIGHVHRVIRRALPGARDAVIPGAGHMLPVTHPEACAALIAGTAAPG